MSLAAAIIGLPLFILLDPMAIFNGFFSLFTENISAAVVLSFTGLPVIIVISWFFPGIWCGKICPLGGLQDETAELRKAIINITRPGKSNTPAKYQGRRVFIAFGTGLLLGLLIPRFLTSSSKKYFRPPASLPKNLFNTLCIRCGSCLKACPGQIIVHRKDPDDPLSWMTPEVTFDNNGYCLEDCNMCSVVCPSGAITQFSREAKKQIVMAIAEVHTDNCLLTERVECDRCKTACSYDAITIEFNRKSMISKPWVDTVKCVGCGACAIICPPRTIEMIPV
jgi:ferredoxin-type protein NapF